MKVEEISIAEPTKISGVPEHTIFEKSIEKHGF